LSAYHAAVCVRQESPADAGLSVSWVSLPRYETGTVMVSETTPSSESVRVASPNSTSTTVAVHIGFGQESAGVATLNRNWPFLGVGWVPVVPSAVKVKSWPGATLPAGLAHSTLAVPSRTACRGVSNGRPIVRPWLPTTCRKSEETPPPSCQRCWRHPQPAPLRGSPKKTE